MIKVLMSPLTASFESPTVSGIQECKFSARADRSEQTFLLKDFLDDRGGGSRLVVIYLHGAAAHQEQGFSGNVFKAAFQKWSWEMDARQAVYICPEYRGGSWMSPSAESDLADIIRWVQGRYQVDKLILAGASMGGTSALIYATRHPDGLDGVIALCPATDVSSMFASFPEQFIAAYGGTPQEIPGVYSERCSRERSEKLAGIPVVIVHGTTDSVIPVSHSQIMVERLQANECSYRYLELRTGNHDSPLDVSFRACLDFVLLAPENRLALGGVEPNEMILEPGEFGVEWSNSGTGMERR